MDCPNQNNQRGDRTFDGAVLKFVRKKKGLMLVRAAVVVGLSVSYMSKLESGRKPLTPEMRDLIMRGYGYSPSSFKNLSTDPVRSKAVPGIYKLEILLKKLPDERIDVLFNALKEEITHV